jgi:hypothetical protein
MLTAKFNQILSYYPPQVRFGEMEGTGRKGRGEGEEGKEGKEGKGGKGREREGRERRERRGRGGKNTEIVRQSEVTFASLLTSSNPF